MLPIRIGLASRSTTISFQDLSRVANALNVQISRDAAPIWHIAGTVVPLPDPDDIQPGTWPVYIVDELEPGMGGYHQTDHNQPFAMVLAGDTWSLSASHEVLEMLVDPSGNRLVAAPAVAIIDNEVRDTDGKFEYLVEVCDPSENTDCAYLIDDVLVSDFYTPNFFDPAGSAGARYSFSGRVIRPRQVLPNGYLSWFNPAINRLQQVRHFGAPEIVNLPTAGTGGSITGGRSLRGYIDSVTPPPEPLSRLLPSAGAVQALVQRNAFMAVAAPKRGGLFAAAADAVTQKAKDAAQAKANNVVSEAEVKAAITANLNQLVHPGVISLRPGWQFTPGGMTGQRAIVATVLPDKAAGIHLPSAVNGVPINVRPANAFQALRATEPDTFLAIGAARHELRQPEFPDERLFDDKGQPAQPPSAAVAALAARNPKPKIAYTAPPGADLAEVSADVRLVLHASPDAGWDQLSKFLAGVEQELVVGMYDFTSGHILDAVERALDGKKLTLTLDHPAPNPSRDQTDEETQTALANTVGPGFKAAWALTNSDRFANAWIYPNAYHIKVAVREDGTFWLSSGNWNNSNQPEIDLSDPVAARRIATGHDRDWHVIATSTELAEKFRAFLAHDYDVASQHNAAPGAGAGAMGMALALPEVPIAALGQPRQPRKFFPPKTLSGTIRIQPLLTPDNYKDYVKPLIDSAERKFYMQTQYIHPSGKDGDEDHDALIAAVQARIEAGVDVRLITSEYQTDDWVEKLVDAGIPGSVLRRQPKVHNKGIVVDDEVVLVSSQNWSADGTLRNRDAGLIIYSKEAAAYFAQIFLHDWDYLASAVQQT
jgi:hypothetical protein